MCFGKGIGGGQLRKKATVSKICSAVGGSSFTEERTG